MLVRHATLAYNLEPIQRLGICVRYSQGAMPAVWLHTTSRTTWAAGHTVLRHGGKIEDVVILLCKVDRSKLKRHGASQGIYYIREDVPPGALVGYLRFEEVFSAFQ